MRLDSSLFAGDYISYVLIWESASTSLADSGQIGRLLLERIYGRSVALGILAMARGTIVPV
jgi:hypothetical protein